MSLDKEKKNYIEETIISCVHNKLQHYKPESN